MVNLKILIAVVMFLIIIIIFVVTGKMPFDGPFTSFPIKKVCPTLYHMKVCTFQSLVHRY
ncbi:hypothetical protein Hanom_Chr14g01313231 [Helianthus anomalus]